MFFRLKPSSRLLGSAATFLAALAPAAFAQAPSYSLIDLGATGGTLAYYRTNGVNAQGQVAGTSPISGGSQAFLAGPGGSPKGLGTVGGSFSLGLGLNNSGQVVGTSQTATVIDPFGDPRNTTHAFLSAPNGGPLKDLGGLSAGEASNGNGVNDQGQVTGYASLNGDAHAFLSGANGGPLKDLGTLPASGPGLAYGPTDRYSEGVAVNDSGQVTGFSYQIRDGDGSDSHAFLSGDNGGPLKDLGTLGGDVSRGLAVNSVGQVTGFAFTTAGNSNATEHAFLSGANGGALQDLGTLGGTFSVGDGVNALGQVVGQSALAPDAQGNVGLSAFLFAGGKMVDLNTLIAPNSGFILVDAAGISDTGFITGSAYDTLDGQRHSYLLALAAPAVPEASTTVSLGLLLALGMGGLVIAARRKKASSAP